MACCNKTQAATPQQVEALNQFLLCADGDLINLAHTLTSVDLPDLNQCQKDQMRDELASLATFLEKLHEEKGN